jgi:pimeloyl-ACP methyl ester carboxylesterase
VSPTSETKGTVFIIDGAGGSGFTPLVFRRTLKDLPYSVQHFRWGTGYMRIISDLTNKANIDSKAAEFAQVINQYRLTNLNHKVFVIAKSAGTVIALKALALLEPASVESVVLLAPAVSPRFPLGESLRGVKKEIVSFWSPFDLFWLGLGTSLFGTADGVHCRAAGLVGFSYGKDSSHREPEKLRQVKWDSSMLKYGHIGEHAGNSMPPYIHKFIVPILTHEE